MSVINFTVVVLIVHVEDDFMASDLSFTHHSFQDSLHFVI